jgi:hypothetical protein
MPDQIGTIVVEKQTEPDGAPNRFTFSGDAAGSISDGELIVVSSLRPGTYTSTETVPAGWQLTGIVCSDSDSRGNTTTRTATFKVALGETVKCTFHNARVQPGTIIVEKQTIPDGAPDSFTFTGDLYGFASDGGQMEMGGLEPGTYSVTEVVPEGWDLTAIRCDDHDSSGSTTTRTATFNVDSGETVKCTFTNTKLGTIVTEKQTVPDGAPDSFTFTGDLYGSIRDGWWIFRTGLLPGTYTSTETVPAGWTLTSIVCDDNNSGGNVNTRTATFQLEAGERVQCTFTNTKPGTIIVEKQTVPDGAPDLFTFSGDAAGSISDGQQIVVSGLEPGTYSSTETVPAGWTLTSILCDDSNSSGNENTRTATFQLEAGETVKCTFHDRAQPGTIIVEKQTVPDGAPDSFTFSGDATGSISDGQQIVVSGLEPGTYTSTETVPAGWNLSSILCDDSNSSGDASARTTTFQLEAGETVRCTFRNGRGYYLYVPLVLRSASGTDG